MGILLAHSAFSSAQTLPRASSSILRPPGATNFFENANLKLIWSNQEDIIDKNSVEKHTMPDSLANDCIFEQAISLVDQSIFAIGQSSNFNSFCGLSYNPTVSSVTRPPAKIDLLGQTPPSGVIAVLMASMLGRDAASDAPVIDSIIGLDADHVLVGGNAENRVGIASDEHSKAYLAKLDISGHLDWKSSFELGNNPSIEGLALTTSGDIVAVAIDRALGASWIIRIAAKDGTLLWKEIWPDSGKSINVAKIDDDTFLVAAFASRRTETDYQEDVSVRSVNGKGIMGPKTIIRAQINNDQGATFGNIKMAPTVEGAYVLSSWEVPFEQIPFQIKPTEIAKVTRDGALAWKSTVQESFSLNVGRSGATFCAPLAIATLPNGNAIVACALRGQIYLHSFAYEDGSDEYKVFPEPTCQSSYAAINLFLFPLQDGKLLIGGAKFGSGAGKACSWLAEVKKWDTIRKQ